MQIDINVKTYSTKQRILAFFMAFMIFTMTCPELFEGWGIGLIVRAVESGPNISINTEKTGNSVTGLTNTTSSNDDRFKYTGNIKPQAVSMYDYLSDEEITGSWNTNITKSKVSGYTDPYTIFNTTISESAGQLYASTGNITIVLQKFPGWASSTDEVCIFMEDDDNHYTTWPGDRMTYHYGNDGDEFIYTFNPTALGFTPTKIKFSKNGSNTIPSSASDTGFMFKAKDDSNYQYGRKENSDGTEGYKTDHTYYVKWNSSINSSAIWEASGAKTIYQSSYDKPLYFGCFLTSDADNASTYTTHTSPNYNNFYWLPNMAQRESDNTNANPPYYGAGHSAVQGLVDDELNDDGKLTQGDEPLPYFDSDWADDSNNKYGSGASAKPIMKYWESGTNDADKIAFPFYEVLTDTSGSSNGAVVSTQPTESGIKYAKYYQFDSKDVNVLFHDATASTKAYFEETSTPIKTNNDSNRAGFFPFNSSNNDTGGDINCGFGAKFEIPFKLNPDGTVNMVNESGEEADGAGTVHARFEFSGDDDLWVFIDGKLMLDMGGAHNKATGYIDFATKTAQAANAYVYDDSIQDNLGLTGDSNPQTVNESSAKKFSQRFAEGSFDANGKYTNIQHKMTIFYMERGMLDSNLLIRYNFSAESNFSKMKVQEITSFENVNAGLLSVTKKAADKDVFKYTVSNKGTDKTHIISASIPSNGNHTRTVETTSTTILTKTGTNPASATFQPANTTDTFPVAGIPYLWVDDFAAMNSVKNGGTGKGAQATSNIVADPEHKIEEDKGSFYLMYGTEVNATAKTEYRESSAEFEGQFDRYSTMTVVQSDTLYTPTADSSNPATLSGTTARTVGNYYTTHKYIWSRLTPSANRKNVELSGNSFDFMNENLGTATHSDSDTSLAPQMTEWFVNTVRAGTLNITKNVTGPSENTNYTFELTLTNVFGGSEAVSDYTAIEALKGVMSGGVISGTPEAGLISQGTSKGTFTLQAGRTLSIAGIPYGTQYTINENTSGLSQQPQTIDGTVTRPTEFNTESLTITVTNTYPTETSVTVRKTGENGDKDLSGAEMELWYRESSPSTPTYSFSDPKIVPNEKNGVEVSKSANDIGVPGPQVNTTKITTYSKSDTYVNPAVPSSDDTDWILPRNDTDYIYFRDYNVGQYAGDRDKVSFTTNANNVSAGQRSWRYTYFAQQHVAEVNNPYTHNQTQELGFNDNYWYAAEFYGSGKKTVRYAMWERFVDKFTYTPSGGSSATTVDTVVWKIQPPDGYTQVRFILLDGDNWIRSTEKFTFNLGEIYHKTSWGGVYSNGNYYDVPVNKYTGKSDPNLNRILWAPAAGRVADNRNSAMSQPRKYEPTNQKVIFYCNSTQVWHNIHIEFFKQNDSTGTIDEGSHKYDRIGGQAFPGYMMEPYAYAESNYRLRANGIEQYLTYELTIPNGATHFRINNGTSGDYAYMTTITELANNTNVKNGGNYWVLNQDATQTTDCSSSPVTLTNNVATITGLSHEDTTKTYSESDITSDYDYIYFDATSAGWDRVYAYFYGGGNLRDDNWQRACYSSWPGVAPVGTEYWTNDGTTTTTVHSNTYSIQTNGDTYNGTNSSGTLSPEAVFTLSDHTIYKFRIPKGDRKNYSKVIFNDGLKAIDGGNETGVIGYEAGYIYNKSGTPTKHYEKSYTSKYTGRTASAVINAGEANEETVTWTEYVYVKNTQNWDDLHITFYDNKGKQIYQKGCGYVMDYAGTLDGVEYYRMPIPADAATFSVNNGIGTTATPKCDITRLGSDAKSTATVSTDDKFVYNLSGNTLTRLGVTVGDLVEHTTTTSESQTESTANYNSGVRQTNSTDDTLNIRDDSPWNVAVGGATVTFYDENGGIVGSGVMMKTNADNDGKIWYTKKIPTNAKSFSVSYVTGSPKTTKTTTTYPIYSSTADSNGNKTSTGDMFYKTVGANQLSMLYAEPAVNKVDDENYEKRGDDLYLICDSNTAPTVTFYGGSKVIVSGITAKYINADESGKHWFKLSIPKGADNFSLGDSSKQYPIYELKTKYSPYQRDYTLGDMQYSVSGTTATPVYPVFKEDSEYTLTVGDTTISSRAGLIPVDESAVAAYANADAPTRDKTTPANQSPVLYETNSTDVTYTWQENSGSNDNYDYIRFADVYGWDKDSGSNSAGTYSLVAHFFKDSNNNNPIDVQYEAETETVSINGVNVTVYKFSLENIGDNTKVYITNRKQYNTNNWDGGRMTKNIVLGDYGGNCHGYLFSKRLVKTTGFSR